MQISAVQKFTVLDYPGKVACIAFTPGCNMRCGFCHNSEFVLPEKIQRIRKSFISEDTFFCFLEERRGLLEGVVVSGGEPTIWQDLPNFLDRIKKLGFLVKLDTNGSRPDVLASLFQKQVLDYVAMDLKADPEGYAELSPLSPKGESIRESIRILMASGVDYEFRSTLIKEVHTTEMLEKMIKSIKGAQKFFLQTFRPKETLDPRFRQSHPFSFEEMESIAEKFRGSVNQVFIRN